MANVNNLKIITEFGELEYKDAESLNIYFYRYVDDLQDISNRFGDFSYDFDLPITKQNSVVFSYSNAHGQKHVFPKNRNISCKVYLNQALLLDGLINLNSITRSSYKCTFFSKFKELIDSLNEIDPDTGKEKTLRSLGFPLIEDWNYETSIINHISTYGDGNSDDTTHQFPLSFYSTYYCQESYYSGTTDIQGSTFSQDRDKQNYYYLLNSIAGYNNRMYIHQLPPAIYIVRIVEQILNDAGWKLGGQFFNKEDVKRIVFMFSGQDDAYDQATGQVSGSTGHVLNIASFLPDMAQGTFLKNIINYFNLYFRIDTSNKILEFETYNTYFNNSIVNPYDITSEVFWDTMETSYIEDNDPTIEFSSASNQNVMGDNFIMTGATNNAYTQTWVTGNSINFNQTFNRVGTDGNTITLDFTEPTVMRKIIYNNYNQAGSNKTAAMHYFYLPILSKQTQYDNNGMKFNKKADESYVFNNESSIKYQGKGSLMYHYGFPTTDFENKVGKGSLADFLYTNIYTGGGINRVPFTICSPFQLQDYRTEINAWLDGINDDNVDDRRTTTATYLQALWQLMGTSSGAPSGKTTSYSLVFDDNGYLHDTLWTKFHKDKWDRYANSEQVQINMRMNSYDWQEMQINRPILFNQELYSLIAIEAYNPIMRTATIIMIKQL